MSLPNSCRPTAKVQTTRRGVSAVLAAGSVAVLLAGVLASTAETAHAAEAKVGLGTAADFAILAGSTITNTNASVISGDVGLSPGSSITGFPPGIVTGGTQHISDEVADTAKDDLTTAYNDATGRPTSADVTDQDLGGKTLTPGVYEATTTMALTGTLTLNAQGNANAVFIFKAGSTLLTATDSQVRFINGGSPCNVFWQVGTSATLGTATRFVGTIMALTSATLNSTASVEGRVLARNGAVTLDTNVITAPDCATASGTDVAIPTISAGTDQDGTSRGGTTTPNIQPTAEPEKTPIIPDGHPETGSAPAPKSSGALFILAGLIGCAAAAVGGYGFRKKAQR